MFYRAPDLHRAHIARIAILLTVLTGLFAEGFNPFSLDHSRIAAASPFFTACSPSCVENFDSVTRPLLPAGWTSTISTTLPGVDLPWQTVNTAFDSFPNSVFAGAPSHVTDNHLVSRTFAMVSTPAVLSFRRRNNLEVNFDGMVLEISIDGGPFVDILSAGGSFAAGGYNGTISTSFASPIAGRMAWTGATLAFVTTTVNLPASVNGRSVTFRWRVATDNSRSDIGVFVDGITLTDRPANDNLRDAQQIVGASGFIQGSNVLATKEGDEEPNHAGKAGGASVWYKWQALTNDRITFTTYKSDFNTVLAVYRGDGFPLFPVANNDDDLTVVNGCGFNNTQISRVSFNPVAGVEYRIAVDRHSDGTTGNIVLRWGRSASIRGIVTDASERPMATDIVTLGGDACRRRDDSSLCFTDVPNDETRRARLCFTDVPTDGRYTMNVALSGQTSFAFSPYDANQTQRISPLTGDVSDFNFYWRSPTRSISGIVSIGNDNLNGVTVTCAATGPLVLFSQFATFNTTTGEYACSGLPIFGQYVVTPAKTGVVFKPLNRIPAFSLSDNIINADFTGTVVHTISGRITQPNGITGAGGVSVIVSGSQSASRVTDVNGDYSFTDLPKGGNYTVTPSNPNATFSPVSRSFNNLSANQTADFTATFSLQLILDELGQVAALDSVLLLRDPLPVINNNNVLNTGVDRNTRVAIFLSNFQLGPGESPSAVVINLVGSNTQSYDIPAEDVRPLSDGFTRVTFRLPDTLTAGTCTLVVKAHGQTSNMGAMRIR